MREILFRGKRIDNGEWVEGSLVSFDTNSGYVYISEPYPHASTRSVRSLICDSLHLVEKETVCQYTGLTDRNGKKIWEKDVCRIIRKDIDELDDGYFIAKWDSNTAQFILDGCLIITNFDTVKHSEVEVIGNIFDNPELMEGM